MGKKKNTEIDKRIQHLETIPIIKPFKRSPNNTTLYRKERSIPAEGRPYVPISVAKHLTGYSISFLNDLYDRGALRGFMFPRCVLLISLYDLIGYIDHLAKNYEIGGFNIDPVLKRRITKAHRIKKESKGLMNDPEYLKSLEKGEASQRRAKKRRLGTKIGLRRKGETKPISEEGNK